MAVVAATFPAAVAVPVLRHGCGPNGTEVGADGSHKRVEAGDSARDGAVVQLDLRPDACEGSDERGIRGADFVADLMEAKNC